MNDDQEIAVMTHQEISVFHRLFLHFIRSVLVALPAATLMAYSVSAMAQETVERQRTAIEYGYPDQSIFVATVNAKGQPDSPMNRLAEVLMARAGLKWHGVPYPASRLFSNLKDGTTNFAILVRAPSLKECCLFSQKPVYSTELKVYAIGDKPSVKVREDLAGKRVITIRGYSYAGMLKYIADPANRVTNEVASTHKAAFEMLVAARADYLLDYASAAGDILAESPIRDLQSTPLSQLDIYLILSRTYPKAEELMARLEAIVTSLDVEEVLKSKAGRFK